MTGINDNDVLDRIKENLEHVPNDVFGSTANEPKFSEIIFGDPENDNKLGHEGPVAYIRTADKTLVATKKTMASSNVRKRRIETKEYWIIIVSKSTNDIIDAIKEVNTLTFKTREIIEKNLHLTKPDGTLPIASDVDVFDVPRDVSMIGKDRQSNTIIVRYNFAIK